MLCILHRLEVYCIPCCITSVLNLSCIVWTGAKVSGISHIQIYNVIIFVYNIVPNCTEMYRGLYACVQPSEVDTNYVGHPLSDLTCSDLTTVYIPSLVLLDCFGDSRRVVIWPHQGGGDLTTGDCLCDVYRHKGDMGGRDSEYWQVGGLTRVL